MTTAIQLRDSDTMADWHLMRQQAETLVKTGFLPPSIKTPDQAVAIVLMGREIGVGIMVALNNINVIAGKPTISPQLMLALINRTGELEDMRIDDDGQCCSVAMRRKGRSAHSEAFSMADAARMKTTEGYGENKKTISLAEKYNWRQMPAVMRKWRAIAACARVVFPDVILGMYTPDEMGAEVEPDNGEAWQEPPEVGPPVTPVEAIELREEVVEVIEEALTGAAVRQVKLEGAQPKAENGKLPTLKGSAGQVTAFAAGALKWNAAQLAAHIEETFHSVVMQGKLAEVLEFMSADEHRELVRTMRAKLGGGK